MFYSKFHIIASNILDFNGAGVIKPKVFPYYKIYICQIHMFERTAVSTRLSWFFKIRSRDYNH